MANIFKLQASGVMFQTLEPSGWSSVFGIFVTDENDLPVTDLKQEDFHVFDMLNISDIPVVVFNNLGVDTPSSNLKAIYRVQTQEVFGLGAPEPQELLYALRVSRQLQRGDGKAEGETTVAITYLGMYH